MSSSAHVDRILARGRALLEAARESRAAWGVFDANLEHDREEDCLVDRASDDRLLVAWAIEFDRAKDEDEALVRYLLEQEVFWRERAPFQGIGETLRILIDALAGYRRVEDAPLFARAKRANFDTFCGLDRQPVAAAGLQQTIDYWRQRVEEEGADGVLDLLLDEDGDPLIEEEDVERWHLYHTGDEREVVDASMLSLWERRALFVEEDDLALELSTARMKSAEGLDAKQRDGAIVEHVDLLFVLDMYAEALVFLEALLERSPDPRGQGVWRRVIEAASHCGQQELAADYLDRSLAYYEDEVFPARERYGLRHTLEVALEHVPRLERELAVPLLERVDALTEGGNFNFVSFLELATRAFEEVGLDELAEKYGRALRDERKRLSKIRI